ncbi:arginase [Breznakiella homolactica]|uniref:Arginase n=1 Tax=Breznakiella homolactica TaxID=2798577 RepID=A0A7T7XKH7_9SPIR|nr:arginase [Breznakiella homolactica]QQO07913.1 arginase [Breznakiella homolactica]
MKVRVIELPLDFGASRRGSDMGPSAIRLAGLKQALADIGHESEESFPGIPVPAQEYLEEGNERYKYLAPIAEACGELAKRVEKAVDDGVFPLVLGGDHSIAIGSLAGLGSAYKKRSKIWGTLWVDAHGDFNTPETTPSGNIHGMSLAAACGYGREELCSLHGNFRKLDPRNVALVGVRDLDTFEKDNMREAGVTVFTMTEVDRLGIAEAARRIISFFRERVDILHVSVDMDAMDPMIAPGVGIPLTGGFSYREVLLLAEELGTSKLLGSAEIVEVNPVLDVRNQTARMAVEIISRLLGGTIY